MLLLEHVYVYGLIEISDANTFQITNDCCQTLICLSTFTNSQIQ